MPRAGTSQSDLSRTLGPKSVQLRVRLTEVENERLHAAMRHVGYDSISDFVRWALLEGVDRALGAPSVAASLQAHQEAYDVVQSAPEPAISLPALLGIPLHAGSGGPRPLELDDGEGWT
jgi:hypothetical protein